MNGEAIGPNDDRFRDVIKLLESLSSSHKNLLTAQVMHDRLERTERNVENLSANVLQLSAKLIELADGQKHTDERIDALADIVRQLIERNGKGPPPN